MDECAYIIAKIKYRKSLLEHGIWVCDNSESPNSISVFVTYEGLSLSDIKG